MSAPERLTAPSCRPASKFQPPPDVPTTVDAEGGQCIVVVREPKDGKDLTRVLAYVRAGSTVQFTATAKQAASNCCVVDLPDPVEDGKFDRDAISAAITARLGWNPLWQ